VPTARDDRASGSPNRDAEVTRRRTSCLRSRRTRTSSQGGHVDVACFNGYLPTVDPAKRCR